MNSSRYLSIFSLLGALAIAHLARAADAVQYSPASTSLQGTEPYTYGPQSIVITPPKLASGTYKITLTVTATTPSGVTSATALGFVSLGGTGVTSVSAGVYSVSYTASAGTLPITFTESVPLGSFAGSYTYTIVASGWPATDSAGNAISAGSSQFIETIAAPKPAISIALPANGQVFTLPSGETTVQVPYDIEGTTVSGTTLTAASGTLTGGAASGFSPVFYGFGTTSITTNIGTAATHATVGLGAGTYTLTASDTNSAGGTASTASTVTFTVVSPSLPTISITSPASGQVFSASGATGTASVSYSITGGMVGGTIAAASTSMVEAGITPAVSVVVFPVTFSGIGTSSVSDSGTVALAPGSYTITASDTGSSGGSTYGPVSATPVTFTVVGAPTISITSPASGAVYEVGSSGTAAVAYAISGTTPSGSSFASSSAATATLTSSTGASTAGFAPKFTVGSGGIASSGTASLAPGTYTIGASDTNNLGGTTSATSVTFTVVGPPTLSITGPASGEVFEISSAGGTAAVSYAISGTTPTGTKFASGTAASATLTSDSGFAPTFTVSSSGTGITASGTVNLPVGTYTLNATETNNLGATATATPVTFTVVGLPTIAITAPANNAALVTSASGDALVTYTITGSTPAGTGLKTASATLTLNGEVVTTFIPTFSGLPSSSGSVTSTTATGTLSLGPGTYTLAASETNNLGATASASTITFTVAASTVTNSISANFTTTAIPINDYLWFSGVVKLQGVGASGTTILFSNSKITFDVGSTLVSLTVPAAVIDFEAGVTTATTTFNATTNTWMTTVPANYAGNVFLSGIAYKTPTAIPGGVANVTWMGTFSSDTAGITATWEWGAAAYSSFGSTLGMLGVKPVDNSTTSAYKDSDNAGAPEEFLSYVVSGGTGTGGTEYTGAYGTALEFSVPDYL